MSQDAISLQANEDGVWVSANDTRICFYQRALNQRDGKHACAHYLHPVYDLDGDELTEDFPKDHLHHRGLFWAWHQLTVHGHPIGDGWMIERFNWDVKECESVDRSNNAAGLNLLVHWTSPDFKKGEQPVVVEETALTFFPDQENLRQIDFDVQLKATSAGTRIGGSNDDKGYGGFSLRVKMPDDLRFASQNGPEVPAYATVAASPWMTMRGSFNSAKQSSITVLTHPVSVGYPQPWILRSKRSMQNPVWPGQHPVELSDTQPTRLRYRVLIHRGTEDSQTINRWQRSYIEDASAAVVA
ncbi:PmoA family protein [Stieleria sp. JC731]|uniref:DUF6807 family protein n=1 Tax=Pirellulaceae TaxID=2691357 RepID=UPI001E3BD6FF|nr:DUF6807 family protein [Stieleria sp. JC731]MCC9604175.1 PmoA family protein [Stieleria sp. JC731]